MRTSAVEDDSTARDAVDQQPVGIDMALEESGILATESMFPECVGVEISPLKQSTAH